MTSLMRYLSPQDDINGWLIITVLTASLQPALRTGLMHSLSGTNDMIRILEYVKYLVHVAEVADGQAVPDAEVVYTR